MTTSPDKHAYTDATSSYAEFRQNYARTIQQHSRSVGRRVTTSPKHPMRQGQMPRLIIEVRSNECCFVIGPFSDAESLPDFVNASVQLENEGKLHLAMDMLYPGMDRLLKAGEWPILNSLFHLLSPTVAPLHTMLGILILTYGCKDKLSLRDQFVSNLRKRLDREGKDSAKLLYGLE